jgi:superfamily II DNA helicase RecQ
MDKYRNLAIYPVQRILLSATVPPVLEQYLLDSSALPSSTLFIRAPTQRPLIRYHVIHLEYGVHLGIHEYTVTLARYLQKTNFDANSNGIIYVTSIADATQIGKSFDDCIYTSQLSIEEKDANVQRWSNGQSKWIVATDGFSHGINRPFVDAVIMVGLPHSFIDLIQQPGRGGRAGRPSMAFLVEDMDDL